MYHVGVQLLYMEWMNELCVIVMLMCVWADFQFGDKPIGALQRCSSRQDLDPITANETVTPAGVSVKIQSRSQLTKTPCILRRRRRKLCTSGKKSAIKCAKRPANSSTSVVKQASVPAGSGSSTRAVSCVTPQKQVAEQILPFSPSQVWVWFILTLVFLFCNMCLLQAVGRLHLPEGVEADFSFNSSPSQTWP